MRQIPPIPLPRPCRGKLPQRKIATTAAAGYSSYGNQIGLATGQVDEIYHPGYVAKRMEIGAVIGAAPAANVVRRERPLPAMWSSCWAAAPAGTAAAAPPAPPRPTPCSPWRPAARRCRRAIAPEERKIQRLFRNPQVTRLIKRCNDFGAGGVSVAIGELADGLDIDLNAVPKKYDGLDGTELAISESQERMAVVVAPEDVDEFMAAASRENLEATVVAAVTEEPQDGDALERQGHRGSEPGISRPPTARISIPPWPCPT